MPVTIRPAEFGDAEAVASLISASATHAFLSSFAPQGRARFLSDHTPEQIRSRIESTDFCYYVAEDDGVIIGVVGIRSQSHLFNLFVSEPMQRQGIGRLLWKHALNSLLNAARPEIVTVNAPTNAVSFYQELGFEVVGVLQDVDGVRFVPMRITLAPNNRWRGP